jgi:hypothetical protein
LFALLGCAGCGRVNLKLLPRPDLDGGVEPDDPEAEAEDSGTVSDGQAESLLDADGLQTSADGACLAGCEVRSLCAIEHADDSCGVGYCRETNTPSSCADGLVLACRPGSPRAASDSSCDGVDDDCDGATDEDYAPLATSCGRGVCARGGARTCLSGAAVDSCSPGVPSSALDDASGAGNGLDDDCDGRVDEDLPGCDTTPRSFEVGYHPDIAVPNGCGRVTVRLWGGGGGGGADVGVLGAGGDGGAGGYVTITTVLGGSVSLLIGRGGADDCNTAGSNAGTSSYDGGSGGSDTGAPGNDGVVRGGGAGGSPSTGRAGGRGHYGGGGGGQGSGGLGASGPGGGGGAASVLLINGVRRAVAGGGGGGGGAQSISPLGTLAAAGGSGGSGCAGAGRVETGNGGGGGGGGVCEGDAARAGEDRTPAFEDELPDGRARGGWGGCGAGGHGYAIVTFSR